MGVNEHFVEECDDGNTDNDDGCSDECLIEEGWACDNHAGAVPSNCSMICGDGKHVRTVLQSEKCDDGNTVSGDGCSDICEIEEYYTCTGGTMSSPDYCTCEP